MLLYGVACGISATSIGTGEANTLALIGHIHTSSTGDTTHTAALQIYYENGTDGVRKEIGGFSDWFLPSKDEMIVMCINLHKQTPSPGGFSLDRPYWSSSEISSARAEEIIFDAGIPDYNIKTYFDIHVRPARVF